jgi:hypothetical protein
VTLNEIIKEHGDKIQKMNVLLLQDLDGHKSFLYRDNGRIALHFQKDYSPIVYPEMYYEVVEFMRPLAALEITDGKENFQYEYDKLLERLEILRRYHGGDGTVTRDDVFKALGKE